MKKLLNTLAAVVDRVVWTVGCFAIIDYASNHWLLAYRVAMVVILVAFGAWYIWAFFVRPLREGLKGQ
jgi:fatty acid desaturase